GCRCTGVRASARRDSAAGREARCGSDAGSCLWSREVGIAWMRRSLRSRSGRLADGRALGPGDAPGEHLVIRHQRLKREVRSIQVVVQVEDLRETRTGPIQVVPRAVLELRAKQVLDAAADGFRAAVAGGHQAHERPGRLSGSAWANALHL